MNVDKLLPGMGFGALIGLALGSLGAGGSILTVPILVYALGVPVQAATGTSLVIVGLNSAAGAVDYLRRGRALPRTAMAFGGSGLAGALAGAWLNHQVRGDLVLVLFALLMLGAAYGLIRRHAKASRARTDSPRATRLPAGYAWAPRDWWSAFSPAFSA